MTDDRLQVLPNGAIYDKKLKKIVGQKTPTEIPQEAPKSTKSAKKTQESINVSIDDFSETDSQIMEKPKKKPKKDDSEQAAHVSHARIAREILAYNRTHKADKTNIKWLEERGFWYFDRCIEEGVTPIPQGLVLALGFKASEQNLLLSGNSGLPLDCRELIGEFKQALELAAEGALVDSKSGTVGRIFDLKNRFGWSDNGNLPIDAEQKFGEIKSPEELKKALAKMPNLDLIDEPKPIDVEFEVVEQ